MLRQEVLIMHISVTFGLLQILCFSVRGASELIKKNEDPQDNHVKFFILISPHFEENSLT